MIYNQEQTSQSLTSYQKSNSPTQVIAKYNSIDDNSNLNYNFINKNKLTSMIYDDIRNENSLPFTHSLEYQ